MAKILIVDDDENIREILENILRKSDQNYDIITACDGEEALNLFKAQKPDIVLLDLMLPKKSGEQVFDEIHKISDCPILIISAKDDPVDRVVNIEKGADDYITKPFNSREVAGRVKNNLNRYQRQKEWQDQSDEKCVEYDGLYINLTKYEIRVRGVPIVAPPKEMELIYHLASNPNIVFSRNKLLDVVWGFEYFGDSRTVDVHIKRLREKLDKVSEEWSLKTVWGVGYKFEVRD